MSTSNSSTFKGNMLTAAFTHKLTKWQMQSTSIILGCTDLSLAITPPLAPFMTLHVSDVKLNKLVKGILWDSKQSFSVVKMPSAVKSTIPIVSR